MKAKSKATSGKLKAKTRSVKLGKNEERFHSAFETMLEGVQMLGHDWRYLYLNPAAEVHNRRPNQELLGNRYMDMWPGIEDTHIFSVIKQCLEDRIAARLENRFIYPDGGVGWFNLSIQPIPEGILILSFDMTERVNAEMQSTQMKRLYAALSQVNQTIVRVKDRHELYQSICDVAVQFGEFSAAWIGLLDEASGDVQPAAANGLDVNHWILPIVNIQAGPLSHGLIAQSFQTSHVMTSDSLQTDERLQSLHEHFHQHGFRSSAVIPFRLRGKTIGTLTLISQDEGAFKADAEIRLLDEMGLDISFALDTMEMEAEHKQAEQALSRERKLLHILVDNLPQEVYVKDRERRFLLANAFVMRALSVQRMEDVIGKRDEDFMPPSLAKQFADEENELMDLDKPLINDEHSPTHKPGPKQWYLRTKIPFHDEAGNVLGLIGIGNDITERKQAEEKIRESQELFRSLFEYANDAIFLISPEGVHIEANQKAVEMLGFERDELIGMTVKDIVAPHEYSAATSRMADLLGGKSMPLYERIFRKKNGVEFPVEVNIALIHDMEDKPLYIQSIVRDITARKRAEEKIQQQFEHLNSLRAIDAAISSSFDIHVTLDIVLQQVLSQLGVDAAAILLLNPQLQTIEYAASRGFRSNALQYTQLQLSEGYAGRAVHERKTIYIPALLEKGGKLAEAMRSANEDFVDYYGIPLISKDGIKGVLEIYHRSPLQPDPDWLDFLETLAGQAAIAIDNAQLFDSLQRSNADLEQRVAQRTAELNQTNLELEHANRTKDEFLATMSHELRTPLNSILGLSETLLEQKRDPLSAHQQRSLQIIATSGQHLLELINDILDLSKIEAGKFEHHPQMIGVDDLCRSSLTLVKEQATRKSITLTYQQDTTISKMYADPRRLKQILVNLLTNAVKFTPDNGQILLQVHGSVEQGRIQFSVIDTGIGIALKDLRLLFVPFSQVDSSLTRQYEGTGLGLALVQKLTDLHGGSVDVESDGVPGKGSRFTINLPIGDVAQPGTLETADPLLGSKPAEKIKAPGSSKLILLAEDNMANILTIGDYLEGHEYQVVVAHDGLSAIEMAEAHQPDIILMDIQMPVLDGLEAIRRLRALPRFAATPIIALTALAMSGDRERCLEAGANEYISKPASLKGLVKSINKLLGKEE